MSEEETDFLSGWTLESTRMCVVFKVEEEEEEEQQQKMISSRVRGSCEGREDIKEGQ